ncbi:MAG: hypothetical protein M1833_005687 [Piccolia ochrophora]|nr:MAG: hypothetical protein M1833_005687 [Piccolia ochrophora]
MGDIGEALLEALDPPSQKNIRRAIDALIDAEALTTTEELTSLGRQVARLPLDVQLGKLVLQGVIFKCLDATVTIAAILSSRSPFTTTVGTRQQSDLARMSFSRGGSDLLTLWNAYGAWRRVCTSHSASETQYCQKYSLNQQALIHIEELKQQLLVSLDDMGVLRLDAADKARLHHTRIHAKPRQFFQLSDCSDRNSDNDMIVNSVIAWSFYPKLLQRNGKGWRNIVNNQQISIHPTSVNKGNKSQEWLSFYHIMQSSNKFYNAHETNAAEEFSIALLCGNAEFKLYAGVIILDGNRIRFTLSDWKPMVALKVLQLRTKDILAHSFREPGKPFSPSQLKWLEIWQRIFDQSAHRKN